jgi:LPXTG-site transpeptidase (sortase) family protein
MQHRTKKQWVLFITGLIAIIIGVSILGFFGARKVWRYYQRQKLMRENPVVEIADLKIKAPILEGTDNKTISRAVGHFIGTGDFGKGNYCIAGHSSVIYKEYFNNLKKVRQGMEIKLYDKDKKCYVYTVSESFIVEPNEGWILDDFGDNRITIITCTDDGSQRQVVVGLLKQ